MSCVSKGLSCVSKALSCVSKTPSCVSKTPSCAETDKVVSKNNFYTLYPPYTRNASVFCHKSCPKLSKVSQPRASLCNPS
jgi:hypothetical protein